MTAPARTTSGELTGLVSPVNGAPLRVRRPGVLWDGERGWPVVAGIPWLRTGRDELRERAVRRIEADDPAGAALALLRDADDWWDQEPPPDDALRLALRARTLREAVTLLGMGRVGDYFLHRWSDPTYLAVLALTGRHRPGKLPVLEAACGAGHLLRELALRGHRDLSGVDVVFAKLWLARRFVVPSARLVCADLTAPWPLPRPEGPAYVACHDALYFLPCKEDVVARALAYADVERGGAVVLGHCHNAAVSGQGAGLPLDAAGWCALLPDPLCYDDAELTRDLLERAVPRARPAAGLAGAAALALVQGPPPAPDAHAGVLAEPVPGRPLRLNPLYRGGRLRWPGGRWREEYAAGAAAYLPERCDPAAGVLADAAAGRLTPAVRELALKRVLLDLPEAW